MCYMCTKNCLSKHCVGFSSTAFLCCSSFIHFRKSTMASTKKCCIQAYLMGIFVQKFHSTCHILTNDTSSLPSSSHISSTKRIYCCQSPSVRVYAAGVTMDHLVSTYSGKLFHALHTTLYITCLLSSMPIPCPDNRAVSCVV